MPGMPKGDSGARSERGSPPTQLLLRPSERSDADIVDLDLSKIDEDPITYFLTPEQRLCDDTAMDFEMEFDAGIEDAKNPAPVVRSISPSSLGGLGRPPPRISSPPRTSSPPRSPPRSISPDTDREMPLTPDDHEDYMYLAASGTKGRPFALGLPFSLRDFAAGKFKAHDIDPTNLPLPPASSSQDRTKPRPGRVVRRGRSRGSAYRRSPHAWREPSPDVWSIEEEPEREQLHSEGESAVESDYHKTDVAKSKVVDIPAAKPKKRVRFVLPDEC